MFELCRFELGGVTCIYTDRQALCDEKSLRNFGSWFLNDFSKFYWIRCFGTKNPTDKQIISRFPNFLFIFFLLHENLGERDEKKECKLQNDLFSLFCTKIKSSQIVCPQKGSCAYKTHLTGTVVFNLGVARPFSWGRRLLGKLSKKCFT